LGHIEKRDKKNGKQRPKRKKGMQLRNESVKARDGNIKGWGRLIKKQKGRRGGKVKVKFVWMDRWINRFITDNETVTTCRDRENWKKGGGELQGIAGKIVT